MLGKTPEATRGLAIFATLIMVMFGGAWVPEFLFPCRANGSVGSLRPAAAGLPYR
jgi:hypothetical protein